MSLRLEVVIRVATLDGTAMAESVEGEISPYGGESLAEELTRASPLLLAQIERARTRVERQMAGILGVADDVDPF